MTPQTSTETLPEICTLGDCGTRREHRTCADCGTEADVIDCGHYQQPAEIAASAYSPHDHVCGDCEAMRECDWFRDGSLYVAVRAGMPEQHVAIGTGDSRREAFESLGATPIQSTGRDSGVRAALCWARGAGWITAAVE